MCCTLEFTAGCPVTLADDMWDTADDFKHFQRVLKTHLFTEHYGTLARYIILAGFYEIVLYKLTFTLLTYSLHTCPEILVAT